VDGIAGRSSDKRHQRDGGCQCLTPTPSSLSHARPPLEGLDLARLPQALTDVYAQIVAARIRIRGLTLDQPLPDEVTNAIGIMRRVASAHEAFVSALPEREDRSAAAFVAGSAHHVCMLADSARLGSGSTSHLGIEAISPDISSALLFLIAEASADAAEMAKQIRIGKRRPCGDQAPQRHQRSRDRARLDRILASSLPPVDALMVGEPGLRGHAFALLSAAEGCACTRARDARRRPTRCRI
jgi:hypothetical protein